MFKRGNKGKMKLFASLLALVFLLTSFAPAFIPGLALGTRNIAYAQGGEEKPAVKNVVLLIGDGMGFEQIEAYRTS
ncbi:MAG: hypothetical protein STSR0004_18940 [Peptococcaceae bacterium]